MQLGVTSGAVVSVSVLTARRLPLMLECEFESRSRHFVELHFLGYLSGYTRFPPLLHLGNGEKIKLKLNKCNFNPVQIGNTNLQVL